VILLDSDVILIDLLYHRDPKRPANRAALARLAAGPEPVGVMTQVLYEVVGKLIFNRPLPNIPNLPSAVVQAYQLYVGPDPAVVTAYAGVTNDDVMAEVGKKMSLGDAVLVAQIIKYAPSATCLISWNAKHFVKKLPVPVLTPADWLATHPSSSP
jgi:hypothetical protein